LIVVSFLPSYTITKETEALIERKVDRSVSRAQKVDDQYTKRDTAERT
jgi:hypothetical protein